MHLSDSVFIKVTLFEASKCKFFISNYQINIVTNRMYMCDIIWYMIFTTTNACKQGTVQFNKNMTLSSDKKKFYTENLHIYK